MKTKHAVTALVWLIAGLTTGASAQTTLKALVKKCETTESVKMNIITERDKNTKKLTKSIITVTIRNDEALVNQFIEAFRKDAGEATMAIEDLESGRMIPTFYRFEGEGGEVSYTLNIRKRGENQEQVATVSVIENMSARNP